MPRRAWSQCRLRHAWQCRPRLAQWSDSCRCDCVTRPPPAEEPLHGGPAPSPLASRGVSYRPPRWAGCAPGRQRRGGPSGWSLFTAQVQACDGQPHRRARCPRKVLPVACSLTHTPLAAAPADLPARCCGATVPATWRRGRGWWWWRRRTAWRGRGCSAGDGPQARHGPHVRHRRRPPCQRGGAQGGLPHQVRCVGSGAAGAAVGHTHDLCLPLPSLRDAGNKYDVSIVDLWSNHAPWPVNQLPKS